MNKHQSYDLIQMQALSLESKILMTKQRIRQWYEAWDGDVYVSFSGGKDSTVLKHIIDGIYKDVPSVFVNTGLEYPEIQRFAMSQPNVVTIRPKMRFDEVIKKYGYPVISKEVSKNVYYARRGTENDVHYRKLFGTQMYNGEKSRYCTDNWKFLYNAPFEIADYCCNEMKKKPFSAYERKTGRKPFIATMAEESALRKNAWLKHGCNAFESKWPKSMPMSFWTEQDVLHYLKKYDIPYCSVYGDIQIKRGEEDLPGQINIFDSLVYGDDNILQTTGCDRTGCIFCMFGCHLDGTPNRFQRLKETHPRLYEYCINGGHMVEGKWQPDEHGLGIGKVLDYIGVKY